MDFCRFSLPRITIWRERCRRFLETFFSATPDSITKRVGPQHSLPVSTKKSVQTPKKSLPYHSPASWLPNAHFCAKNYALSCRIADRHHSPSMPCPIDKICGAFYMQYYKLTNSTGLT